MHVIIIIKKINIPIEIILYNKYNFLPELKQQLLKKYFTGACRKKAAVLPQKSAVYLF